MKILILFVTLIVSAFGQNSPFAAKVGQQVTLTATADGLMPFTYQWRKAGAPITGATVNPLLITIKDASDAGSYDVIVKNQYGSTTSPTGVLNVTTPVLAPVITSQPVSVVINLGGNTSFSVVATGTGPFTYQWNKNGAIIPPSTGPNLYINGATTADVATYTCTVTNTAGSATSAGATLGVAIPLPSNIVITFSAK